MQKRKNKALSALDAFREKIQKPVGIDLEAVNKELLSKYEASEKKLQTIIDLDKNYKPIKIIPQSKTSEATAVMLGADWHLEERVDPETVNNRNCYNLKIAEKRAINFFANGFRLVEIMAKDIQIKELILYLLGDLMNGYIHEEFVEDNQLSPTQTFLKLYTLICSGIEYLLDRFDGHITVPCSMGNHGRTMDKSRISTAYKNSYEWLLYHMIADKFKDNPRITFIIEKGYHTYIDVYGFTLRSHHGDWMKYMGGVGGLTIPVNKAIAQWNKFKHADYDIFGHWHTEFWGNNFISSGSLVGYNAYAQSIKADYDVPKQEFFLIHKKYGRTMMSSIFLD